MTRSLYQLATLAVCLLLVGCGRGSVESETPAHVETPPAADPVVAVSPGAESLVRGWLAALDETDAIAPGITILVVDEGLALGMLARGDVAAAVTHRRATPEESTAAESAGLQGDGRIEHVLLARDSIALAVNPTNPHMAVTREQARGLLTGAMRWDAIPWPAAPMGQPTLVPPTGAAGIYLRGEGDSSRRGLALLKIKQPGPAAVALGSDRVLMERLLADPSGLALVPLRELTGGLGQAQGKALGLRGDDGAVVLPDAGRKGGAIWPLLRPLYLVRPTDPGTAGEALVAFAHSPRGKSITAKSGFLPASPVGPSRPAAE